MNDTVEQYSRLDCVGLIRAIAVGELGTQEVRRTAIEALSLVEDLNAVAEIYFDRVAFSASSGLLCGVPILHKDGGAQIEGLPREYGSALGAGGRCTHTSHFFSKLLSEGCEIVGRSRVPELHMSVLADNALSGSVRNPWQADRSMGGSTGGVSALAAGAVPVVHGGDSGGSLRVPAAWSGCYTLKPSRGWVSASPGGTELLGLNEIFVATRSLRDLRLFSEILRHRAADDPPVLGGSADNWSGADRSVFVCESFYPGRPVSEEARKAMSTFASAAEGLGFRVERGALNLDFEAVCEALHTLAAVDLLLMVKSLSASSVPDLQKLCQPYIARWYSDGLLLGARDVVRATETFGRVSRIITAELNRHAFIVTPATALPAPPLETVHQIGVDKGSRALNGIFEEIVHFAAAPNMSGHPALVMPFHKTSKLEEPVGVQIIGQLGGHAALFDFAALLDEGFSEPPRSLSSGPV